MGPREHRHAQIDGRGIQCVAERVNDFDTAGVEV
jgi:hypothetical protein